VCGNEKGADQPQTPCPKKTQSQRLAANQADVPRRKKRKSHPMSGRFSKYFEF